MRLGFDVAFEDGVDDGNEVVFVESQTQESCRGMV